MVEPGIFYEIFPLSLTRQGEEVCGDQVKLLRTADKTIVVLSDGLGSGIKAGILARLTTEILVTMLKADAPLQDVVATVTGTLPTCRVRGLAYATFAALQIQNTNGCFQFASFDSPPPVLLRKRQPCRIDTRAITLGGKALQLSEGVLEHGDFLGLFSDGVSYAGKGVVMDTTWDWNAIAQCLANAIRRGRGSAQGLVRTVMDETQRRYGEAVGDDATFVGVLARKPRRLLVFTGPPADRGRDEACVERLMQFEGRRVVCGGTTANIVAENMGEVIHTDSSTARDGIPAVANLQDVDLVTEGILTVARALDLVKASGGNPRRLPVDRNGAVLLARELLQADSICFLAGESVNPHYQNPQLPRSVSIRRSLVTQVADALLRLHKDVVVEWI